MVGIQVYDHDYEVASVFGLLAVTDELIVGDGMEAQTVVAMQCRILAPDAVHPRDQLAQAVRPIDVPAFDFVLFGVLVFVAAGFRTWRDLAELERRAVDAVAGAESGGEDEAHRPRRETT